MKKKNCILILCICVIISGCGKLDSNNAMDNVVVPTESIETHDKLEKVESEDTIPEKTSEVIENYEAYSGSWTEGGISSDTILNDGGTQITITITNGNQLKGELLSQQEIGDRIAGIDNIRATIENKECFFDFSDDGWGGTGTLHMEFLVDEIKIDVINYEMDENNQSGFGVMGVYHLKREDKEGEKSKEDLGEQDLQEQNLQDIIYNRYYSQWSEEEMIAAIEEKSSYRKNCSFYNQVTEYMENVREVRDISYVVEPLYYTDLMYYDVLDFEDAPLLIIYLAKNELYARHGYIFKDQDLNNYFMGQLWYTPTSKPEDFKDSVFNEYEKANLKLLVELDTYNKPR